MKEEQIFEQMESFCVAPLAEVPQLHQHPSEEVHKRRERKRRKRRRRDTNRRGSDKKKRGSQIEIWDKSSVCKESL